MDFRKESSYFHNVRTDLLPLLPKNKVIKRMLEIGCGDGSTSFYLKNEIGVKEAIGIEVNEALRTEAEKNLDEVIIGNVEDLVFSFEKDYFDLILFADVLEHLYNPWEILKKIRPFLKSDGIILSSIPNVQHWSILAALLRGNWHYEHEGILDNTHIRFFTKKSIQEMFRRAGYKIDKIRPTMGKEVRIINYLTFGIFSGFLSYRYFVVANKD